MTDTPGGGIPGEKNKKITLIVIVVLLVIVLGSAVSLYFVIKKQKSEPASVEKEQMSREAEIKAQLEELNKLPQTLTAQEAEEQLKNLQAKESQISEEEAKKQLEELNKN
jgi:flagellar basal body-associated protein FliL